MTDIHPIVASCAAVDAITTLRPPLRPEALAFRLRGVPAVGRWTRWLSSVPLITAWVRPRLHVDHECLVITWGPWARRVPLSSIVRVALTNRGIALGLSDSTKVELFTVGGLMRRRPRAPPQTGHDAFKARLCAHVHACRGRALARALTSYRARGG